MIDRALDITALAAVKDLGVLGEDSGTLGHDTTDFDQGIQVDLS